MWRRWSGKAKFSNYASPIFVVTFWEFKLAVYSVGTWDTDLQAYTPQVGLSVPSINITWRQLLRAVRELKRMGYRAHRRRQVLPSGKYDHDDNDWSVLIERTDGFTEAEILKSWER